MHRLILLTLSLFLGTCAYGQDGTYALGARGAALAGAICTVSDGWSIFNNPGAVGSLTETTLAASYQNRYYLQELQVVGGGFTYHHKLLNAGLKYFKFGNNLYSQQTSGIILSNRIQMVSLGIGLNIIQTAMEGFQTTHAVALELGGVAEINQRLQFGAHIFNLKHTEHYPTTMKLGMAINPIDPLKINIEVEKQLQVRERVKTGIEYTPIKWLDLRTGIIIQPNSHTTHQISSTYGLGFNSPVLLVDYAFSSVSQLGAIHELSLTYKLKKR